MTTTDPTELVLSIERALPVADWRYSDVDLWPLLRQQIWLRHYYADASNQGRRAGKPSQAVQLGLDQVRWARARWSDRAHEAPRRTLAEVVVLGGGGVDRVRQPDGSWCDRWGDSLGELFEGAGATVLQLDPHHCYRVPRQRPSRLIQPVLDVLKLRASRVSDIGAGELAMLQQQLVGSGGQTIGTRSGAAYVDLAASWFESLLRTCGARLAVYVDWGPTSQAFALAAGRVGVVSAEVQHGVHDRCHPHYGDWQAFKAQGYSVHPDVYWVWRDDQLLVPDWADAGSASSVLVGGNPPLERWLASVGAADSHRGSTVLVTLQPGRESVEDLGVLLAAMSTAGQPWTWWLRHHPRAPEQERRRVSELVRSTGAAVETERAGTAPLLELLLEVDAHVTVTSSAVLEAAAVGVRSVLLGGEEATRLFAADLSEGTAVLAGSAAELLAALDLAAAARTPPRNASDLPQQAARVLLERARGRA